MRWGDTEWRQLSNGDVVNVPKRDVVSVVSVVFADEAQRQRDYPKQYDYCINRLGLGEVLDFMGFPYECEPTLFDDADWRDE